MGHHLATLVSNALHTARELAFTLRWHAQSASSARTEGLVGPGMASWERLAIRDPSAPSHVRATWMGTAGVLLCDGTTRLLIDPFVSRPPARRVLFGLPLAPDPARVRHWVDRLELFGSDAVLVTHAHYDHVLDAPLFARLTGARLVGSPSVVCCGLGQGLGADRLVAATAGQPLQFGAFTVTFLRSEHSRVLLGRVPFPGTIDAPLAVPARAAAFRHGGVLAIHVRHPTVSLVHLGSSTIGQRTFDAVCADIALVCLAGRANDGSLLPRVVKATGARVVIPIHFDDFFLPLDQPLRPLPRVGLDRFVDEANRLGLSVATLPLGEPRALLPRQG
jgi:L-ascorbate metabolism protein UlaG (beta-lactamase superfamily)